MDTVMESQVFEAAPRKCAWSVVPKILAAAAAVTHVPLAFVANTTTRDRRAVYARHLAMYIACYEYGMSTTRVAAKIGMRDHTTVLHGLRKVERIRFERPECNQHLRLISDIVAGQLPRPELVPMDQTWGDGDRYRRVREETRRKRFPETPQRPIELLSPEDQIRAASAKLCDLMRRHHPRLATPAFSARGTVNA